MHIQKLFVYLGLLDLAGCSTIISEYIAGQQSFSYEYIASSDELIGLGFQKSNYCLKQGQTCIGYLTAKPLTDNSPVA